MMDLVPEVLDGAIVLNLQNNCMTKSHNCEGCTSLMLNVYNWIMQSDLKYIIIDLQDEKDICPTFLTEALLLRKRIKIPFLFAGVMEKAQSYLEKFNYFESYPIFVTAEDAVRALRIMHPSLTESNVSIPTKFGLPLLAGWRQLQGLVGDHHNQAKATF